LNIHNDKHLFILLGIIVAIPITVVFLYLLFAKDIILALLFLFAAIAVIALMVFYTYVQTSVSNSYNDLDLEEDYKTSFIEKDDPTHKKIIAFAHSLIFAPGNAMMFFRVFSLFAVLGVMSFLFYGYDLNLINKKAKRYEELKKIEMLGSDALIGTESSVMPGSNDDINFDEDKEKAEALDRIKRVNKAVLKEAF